MTMLDKKDRPDTRSPASEAMQAELTKVRDVAGGYSTIRDKSTTYLPKHPGEQQVDYNIRLNRPTFFNAFSRSVDGLTGMVFRRNPELSDDVPETIQEHWENIDNRGTHGDVFLKEVFADALEAGHAGILVDFPVVENAEGLTIAEEKARRLRPYWVHILKEDIFSFPSVVVDGQTILAQVVIRERTFEKVGEFGEEKVVRYRVFTRGSVTIDGKVETGVTFQLWKVGEDDIPHLESPARMIRNVAEIPLIIVYGHKTGFFTSKPPLIDLATINILHYVTNSDYHHNLHMSSVPTLVIRGAGDDFKITIGPNSAVTVPEGADVKYIETSGAALGASRVALEDIKGELAVLGLSMLSAEKRAAETAEAKRMDKSEKDSALATAARSLQDAAENALLLHAQYLDPSAETSGSLTINRDFEQQQLTPQAIDVIGRLVQSGDLSQETLWQMLQEGEILPDDFDPEVERDRLDNAGLREPAEV